ncbi:MAG: hypothetical protein GX911_00315 [Spirochaetales bacterium]|nr:hypothetical protein [Spirochaetales bacterium]
MKKKDIVAYCIASTITILLNLLMTFVFRPEDPTISYAHLAVIALTVFMTYLVWKGGKYVERKRVRFELSSIWTLPIISAVWFINRVFPGVLPDIGNWIAVGVALVMGTAALLIAIGRMKD